MRRLKPSPSLMCSPTADHEMPPLMSLCRAPVGPLSHISLTACRLGVRETRMKLKKKASVQEEARTKGMGPSALGMLDASPGSIILISS